MLRYAILCYDMLRYAMICCAMLCYAILRCSMLCYAALCYALLCYAALCSAMHTSTKQFCNLMASVTICAMLCYAILCCSKLYYVIHGNRRSRDFFQLATASSSSANNSLYVDYYTYIESTRVVRKPRATRCLRENATVLVRLRARRCYAEACAE